MKPSVESLSVDDDDDDEELVDEGKDGIKCSPPLVVILLIVLYVPPSTATSNGEDADGCGEDSEEDAIPSFFDSVTSISAPIDNKQ